MWLSKGSNPREVTPIFSFLIFKTELMFFLTNVEQKRKLYEKSCNSPPLIFNELQANHIEMKVNCKTVIFNQLQLYETNCNDKKKENQVAEMWGLIC